MPHANIHGVTQRNEDAPTTLDGYQAGANETAVYPGHGEDQIVYPAIAMCEEAGELAGVVLDMLEKRERPPETAPYRCIVAEATLGLAAACGALMGLVKKVYRNDPPGELTAERTADIKATIRKIERATDRMSNIVPSARRVEFPSISVSPDDQDRLVKEVGDVLWYVACFCTEAHTSLGHVGDTNYAKLADRARRDVLRSTGDNR